MSRNFILLVVCVAACFSPAADLLLADSGTTGTSPPALDAPVNAQIFVVADCECGYEITYDLLSPGPLNLDAGFGCSAPDYWAADAEAQVKNGMVMAAEAGALDQCGGDPKTGAASSADGLVVSIEHLALCDAVSDYTVACLPSASVRAETVVAPSEAEIAISTLVDSAATELNVDGLAEVMSSWRSLGPVGFSLQFQSTGAGVTASIPVADGLKIASMDLTGETAGSVETDSEVLTFQSTVSVRAMAQGSLLTGTMSSASCAFDEQSINLSATFDCPCRSLVVSY